MHMKSCTQSAPTLNCLLWYRVHNVWPKLERHESEIHAKFKRERCLLHQQSSDLMPLYDSHAYFQDERRGENRKTETRVCHQIPSGRLCFLAFQSDVVLRPCVWPWLLNPASSTQPQFKTRVWEAPSSLTQFSEFSAWLWWEMYESLLCAFLKAHPSQMALCRVATAAQDSHRWRTQKRTFEGDHFRSTCWCE